MGIWDRLKAVFKRSKALEINQSIDSNHQSIALNRFESEIKEKKKKDLLTESPTSIFEERGSSYNKDLLSLNASKREDIVLERDSIELGLAAGYLGKSIKTMEDVLRKIEDNMVTRDWFSYNINEGFRKLAALIARHDESVSLKLSLLESLLRDLKSSAEGLPQPFKSEFISKIESAEKALELTPRMKEIMHILQERKEISYSELAKILGISESALRGLLSLMSRRLEGDKVERFIRNGKGWVRLKCFKALDRKRSNTEEFKFSNKKS